MPQHGWTPKPLGHVSYAFIYRKHPEWQIYRDRKYISGCQELEGGTTYGLWRSFGDGKAALELDRGGGYTTLWMYQIP